MKELQQSQHSVQLPAVEDIDHPLMFRKVWAKCGEHCVCRVLQHCQRTTLDRVNFVVNNFAVETNCENLTCEKELAQAMINE